MSVEDTFLVTSEKSLASHQKWHEEKTHLNPCFLSNIFPIPWDLLVSSYDLYRRHRTNHPLNLCRATSYKFHFHLESPRTPRLRKTNWRRRRRSWGRDFGWLCLVTRSLVSDSADRVLYSQRIEHIHTNTHKGFVMVSYFLTRLSSWTNEIFVKKPLHRTL